MSQGSKFTLPPDEWLVSSDAPLWTAHHLCPWRDRFEQYHPVSQVEHVPHVFYGSLEVKGRGMVRLNGVCLQEVLHVPELKANHLSLFAESWSLQKADDAKYQVVSQSGESILSVTLKYAGLRIVRDNLMNLPIVGLIGSCPDHLSDHVLISSDTTIHCSPNRDQFTDLTPETPTNQYVQLPNGCKCQVHGVGTLRLTEIDFFSPALYIPDLTFTILSLSQLQRNNPVSFYSNLEVHSEVVQNRSTSIHSQASMLPLTIANDAFVIDLKRKKSSSITNIPFRFELDLEGLPSDLWVVSTSAPRHLTRSDCHLLEVQDKKFDGAMGRIANGFLYHIHSIGQIHLGSSTLTLTSVSYSPELVANVISVPKLISDGYRVYFDANFARVFHGEKVVLQAKFRDGLYTWQEEDEEEVVRKKDIKPKIYGLSLLKGRGNFNVKENDDGSEDSKSIIEANVEISGKSIHDNYFDAGDDDDSNESLPGEQDGLIANTNKNNNENSSPSDSLVIDTIHCSTLTNSANQFEWFFTTETSFHLVNTTEMFSFLEPCYNQRHCVAIGSTGERLPVRAFGEVRFGGDGKFCLRQVRYVPGLPFNLISLVALRSVPYLNYDVNHQLRELTVSRLYNNQYYNFYQMCESLPNMWPFEWYDS